MLVNATIKQYPIDNVNSIKKFNQSTNIGCYCEKYVNTSRPLHHLEKTATLCHLHDPAKIKARNAKRKLQSGVSSQSVSRSKSKILDYALSNNFNYFLNLTFDPLILDPFDHELTKKSLSKWLNTMRKRYPTMQYILVPELHKSGAIHFHGLFNLDNPILTKAINPKTNKLLHDKKRRQIYNLPQYNYGFSQVTKIDNSEHSSYYITKYINKDLENTPLKKKRYWISKNLNKPTITHTPFIPNTSQLNITSEYTTNYYTKLNYKTENA